MAKVITLKLVIGMSARKKNSGFTLIEILIVVVIITITMNFAMLAFNDFGEKSKIKHFAENFTSLISLIKKEAIITDETLAIRINKNNYEVLKLNNNTWQSVKNSIYKKSSLPNGATMFLITKKHSSNNNLIIVNSAGRVTPFVLTISKGQDKIIITIVSDSAGNIKINEK